MTSSKDSLFRGRSLEFFLHVVIWGCIFASPLLFRRSSESIDWMAYLRTTMFPLLLCVIFYLNYLWLIPSFFLKKRIGMFVFYNLAIYLLAAWLWREFFDWMVLSGFPRARRPKFHGPPRWIFQLHDIFNFLLATGIAIAVKLSLQWRRTEEARREAEQARTEAELQNLKSQINPHFLLNTLNNIYALTAFDTEKAQEAILELSRLLRYMLYDNQAPYVSLRKEAEFLRTYVELMRIRMGRNVDISLNFDIPEDDAILVAPLIFISLVENAFKHGVSPTKPSFIHISLAADDESIRFTATNSNFPKNATDKAGSGIGLKQVKRRLELSYPECHTWHSGTTEDGSAYLSSILIYPPKKLRP